MGVSAYLYNDYVKDLAAASITITNENPTFPTENLQTEQIAQVCRTLNKAAIKLQFTLTVGMSLKVFYLGNQNFSGGTFDINSYTAADFATGKTTIVTKAARPHDVYYYPPTLPAVRQYWEYDFTNTTSADAFFYIGRAMLHTSWVQLTAIEDFERVRGYGFRNIINETAYGIRWVHRMTAGRERFGLAWRGARGQTASGLPAELKTLYDTVYGDAYPFLFVPDVTLTDCYYVYIDGGELKWVDTFGQDSVSNVSLDLIEAARGKL